MKKIYAVVLAMAMMLCIHTTAFAVVSPSGTSIETEQGTKSPKTGDGNILYVEVAGVLLAVTALAAGKRSRQTAKA